MGIASRMMEIHKKGTDIYFNINGRYSEDWFSNDKINRWEPETFHILEHYSNKDNGQTYIDIGSWIGPTALYAANIYDKVIAIEPDPGALVMLKENLSVNNFSNINLIEKAISDKIERVKFGGNGGLGNSQSTLLVNMPEYLVDKRGERNRSHHFGPTVEVETTTIEEVLEEQNVDIHKISLIKMDIEGSELIVVPAMQNFLRKYKPPFYLSLHHIFLKPKHSQIILDILFDIYQNCYDVESIIDCQKWQKTNKQSIMKKQCETLLFEG